SRQSHNDDMDPIVFRRQRVDARDHAVDAVAVVLDGDGFERPRERSGRVADREPDATRADVDANRTHIANAILSHSLKRILLALVVVSAGVALACGRGRAPEKFRQKLVILGFDGMDPKLVQKWMDEGKLPNMKKLAAAGSGVR